jgi:dihydroorotase
VLRLEKGNFGFVDQAGGRFDGTQKLLCELTLRDGKAVYDLNGMTALPWEKVPVRAPGASGPPPPLSAKPK